MAGFFISSLFPRFPIIDFMRQRGTLSTTYRLHTHIRRNFSRLKILNGGLEVIEKKENGKIHLVFHDYLDVINESLQ